MTLVMMCLANHVETLQGDPSTEFKDVHNKGVVSYGNRLYCNYDENGKADHGFGSTTIYSKYFLDYRNFLQRPYHFANKQISEISSDEEVYLIELDLKQFFDLINRKKLIEKISDIADKGKSVSSWKTENAVMNVFKAFEFWEWSEQARREYSLLCKTKTVAEARNDGLPQGLVASGFLSNIYLLDFDSEMGKMIGKSITMRNHPIKGEKGEESCDIHIIDYCRYVDDMRLVVVGPSRKIFSSGAVSRVKSRLSAMVRVKLASLGLKLRLNYKKTKIEIYRGKSVGISATLENIQSKVSGPISMEQGGSILRLFFVHQAYDVKNLGEK